MIIFLDFDGVITHEICARDRFPSPGRMSTGWSTSSSQDMWYALDSKCIEVLNKLVALTNAKVVISSTWRQFYTLEQLTSHLKKYGFTGEVIGTTPWKMSCYWRDQEIQWWIEEHKYEGDYLILDDEQYHLENAPADKFVHIHMGWEKGGLTSARAKLELTQLLKLRGIEWEQ